MSGTAGFRLVWLLAATIGLALAVQPAHALADVSHYKYWARLGATQGVAAFYSGVYAETYAIYPPLGLYALALLGRLYQAVVDPSFELEAALASHWLTVAIRLLALGMQLVLGGVLFRLLAPRAGAARATIGAGAYLLNPGALRDVAVWGQPDSWHSLFALLGIWAIGLGRSAPGGGWLGLAAMTKPQAWALLPLSAAALLRQGGARGAAVAGAAGGMVTLVVVLPFLLAGRLRELLTLPGQISSVMTVASANAHNLRWLVTRGAEPFVFDSERLGSLPLTYRQAALGLVLVALAFTLWRVWLARGVWELAGLAAYAAHAWFSLTTAAHENHAFMAFPFLCLVWWRSRFLGLVLALLIAAFSFNVLVHDFGLAPLADSLLGRWNWRLQMAASALNLLILAAWTVWLVRSPR